MANTVKPSADDLVRKSEAAARAGCSERTIDRALRDGRLQGVRRGSRIYVLCRSLEAWLQLEPL